MAHEGPCLLNPGACFGLLDAGAAFAFAFALEPPASASPGRQSARSATTTHAFRSIMLPP